MLNAYYTFQTSVDSGTAKLHPGQKVRIDINGSEKGPNIYGKDIFVFIPGEDLKLIPFGYELAYNQLTDKNIQGSCPKKFYAQANGSKENVCAARIFKDGWKINYW